MFSIGDLVRFDLETAQGFTEQHYATIEQFRKRDRNNYRRPPTNPYAAFLAPEHASTQVLPLAKLTPAVDDFEIVTDPTAVHAGAGEWNDYHYRCLRCARYSYKSAQVMAVHKKSGQRVRLCDDCFEPRELALLGHEVLWYQRNSKDSVLALRASPELITGAASNSFYEKSEGESYREWADAFPWLVPGPAAELYKKWKEEQRASATA
ncbi:MULTISPECIES: hypothetical protein [Streptomyces]|uniref:Uncharacterized protein n=2 Tax=Streptomyces TaxID=1883 RepID=A0ABV9J8X3_9ACTN